MRLAAQAKGGFYPTPERVVDFIATLIRAPAGYYYRNREVLRILDPCCGAGEAVAQLGERLTQDNTIPIETYGVELHTDRAEETAPWPQTCSRPPSATRLSASACLIRHTITTRKASGRSTHS